MKTSAFDILTRLALRYLPERSISRGRADFNSVEPSWISSRGDRRTGQVGLSPATRRRTSHRGRSWARSWHDSVQRGRCNVQRLFAGASGEEWKPVKQTASI